MQIAYETAAERAAAFARTLELGTIPAETREKAKLHAMDAIGIALRATKDPVAHSLTAYLSARTPGTAATAFGTASALDDAITVNAALSHALDFDDTDEASLTHPSAPVVPAVLAVAAAVGASGDEALSALIVGLETITAFGAVACSDFHSRYATSGFHPTAICGAPAVALATGRLLGLDTPSLAGAVAIAASLAGGSSQVISRGLRTKMLNVGRAASTGLFAAETSAAGFPGGRGLLEESRGFFEVFAGGTALAYDALDSLGERWRTDEIAFKEFPAGFGEHPFIRGALEVRRRTEFGSDEVVEVVYGDLESQIANASEPADEKRHPPTGYHGKFSRYYCIASALVRGHADVEDYSDESAHDERVISVAEKTRYEISTERWLKVRLRDGRVLEVDLPGPVGSLDAEAVSEKFRRNCSQAGRETPSIVAAFEELWAADAVAEPVTRIFASAGGQEKARE
jgi:2-methylcitrate dehydratase PrpD